MTIYVNKVQRATLTFDRSSTVLDLIQALTENLGGEWDNAVMKPAPIADPIGKWSIEFVMPNGDEEPNRRERWETDEAKHTAVWDASQARRMCNCGVVGTEQELAAHLQSVARGNYDA